MRYPVLLFDLDKTLLDTDANAKHALRQMQLPFDFPFDDSQIAYWNQLNEEMWAQFERQELTRNQLVTTRFTRYFDHFGHAVDGALLDPQFQRRFFAEHALLPHAREVLTALKAQHQLVVISNGSKRKQDLQLTAAGIRDDFTHLFLAEDLGHRKPEPAFFNDVQRVLNAGPASDLLVIGDSLTADIQGANRAQLPSVWVNPDHLINGTAARPTYEIADLRELLTIVAD